MKEIKKQQRIKLISRSGEVIEGIITDFSSVRVYVKVDEKSIEIAKKFEVLDEFIVDVLTLFGTMAMVSSLISEIDKNGIIEIENNPTRKNYDVQKRNFVRINCNFEFNITENSKKYSCRCINISAGGLAFTSSKELSVGSFIMANFSNSVFKRDLKSKIEILKFNNNVYKARFLNLTKNQETVISKFVFEKMNEK